MEFYTQWNRPPVKELEMNDGETITEVQGYIPAKKQIENLLTAGARLSAYRRELYDFGPGDEVPEGFEDPTRSPNFDMADASALGEAVERRLRAQAKAAKEAVAKEQASSREEQPKADVPTDSE